MQVIEARRAIATTEPATPEWDAEVTAKVLMLVHDTLPVLSKGFADGVVFVFAGCWLVASGFFAMRLSTGDRYPAVACTIAAIIPFLLSFDVASASSECDTLQKALNDKRIADLSEKAAAEVLRLEMVLDRTNRKQGLGFTSVNIRPWAFLAASASVYAVEKWDASPH